jgi:hypothetical protein
VKPPFEGFWDRSPVDKKSFFLGVSFTTFLATSAFLTAVFFRLANFWEAFMSVNQSVQLFIIAVWIISGISFALIYEAILGEKEWERLRPFEDRMREEERRARSTEILPPDVCESCGLQIDDEDEWCESCGGKKIPYYDTL